MARPGLAALDVTVPAGDGLILKGTLTYPATNSGSHHPLAVLAHQYPSTRDSFAPLVADLLMLGVATLAFDERGHGASIHGPAGLTVIATPHGFTLDAFGMAFVESAGSVGFANIPDDILRVAAWGANQNFIALDRILLVGASIGGSAALVAAPSVPGLKGVLTFGAAGAPALGADGPDRIVHAVGRLTAPCLLTSSRGDPFDGEANARTWAGAHAHASTKFVDGAGHAMDIYYDVRDDVLAFVRSALAP